MDTSTAKPQAVDTVEKSTSPEAASASAPRSPETVFGDQTPFLAPRPRKMRSGAIAAGCALAVVLAVTAIPTRSGPSGPAAGYAPIARLAMSALQAEDGLPTLHLGEVLGSFALPGLPAWSDYDDGTAVLSVWFRSTTVADAAFAGEIRFSRPVDGAQGASEALALIDPSILGSEFSTSFEGARGYARIDGELYGRGAYDGVVLRIKTAKGAIARRGVLNGANVAPIQDAILARFDWIATGDPVRDVPLPERGSATLGARLTPRGQN